MCPLVAAVQRRGLTPSTCSSSSAFHFKVIRPSSSVSTVSDYGLDDRAIEVRCPVGARDFPLASCVQTGSGTHPTSCSMGTGGPFPGRKSWPWRDADHSPLSRAEVVNE
jgi:hypothetical protein